MERNVFHARQIRGKMVLDLRIAQYALPRPSLHRAAPTLPIVSVTGLEIASPVQLASIEVGGIPGLFVFRVPRASTHRQLAQRALRIVWIVLHIRSQMRVHRASLIAHVTKGTELKGLMKTLLSAYHARLEHTSTG